MSQGLKLVLLGAEILTVVSAAIVALHPNILYSTVALLFALTGIAVMFLYAGADFIAGAQVVVYIGGVTILILFAIMLTHWLYKIKFRDIRNAMLIPAAVAGLALIPPLFTGLRELSRIIGAEPPANPDVFSIIPKTDLIGKALLSNYLLPFETITVLLLGALVGAVMLARPK